MSRLIFSSTLLPSAVAEIAYAVNPAEGVRVAVAVLGEGKLPAFPASLFMGVRPPRGLVARLVARLLV